MNKQRVKEAEKLLQAAYNEGLVNGLSEGRVAARRIMIWWAANHELVKPYDPDTLKEWSQNELDVLFDKIRKAQNED